MKIGIDSYCFHRLFGEVYPGQTRPDEILTFEAFLRTLPELKIDGVSLESCFIPDFSPSYLKFIKGSLDASQLDRVYAWGHPDGLEGGGNEKAYEDMLRHIEYASQIGAKVMRVVGSSLKFRFQPHEPQLEKLTRMFSSAAKIAARYDVRLAVENHIDYNSDELLKLIKDVDSPNLGINFDSGNFLRVLDDPLQAMQKLAPYVLATHIKDLKPVRGVPVNEWYFFSCVPTGEGLIENDKLVELLSAQGYEGFLAVEIDFLHPDYINQEEAVVKKSVSALRQLAKKFS
jgi:3-oxoisoapionate decarboxylase